VRIGGKLYCKEDADRVFGNPKKESPRIEASVVRPLRLSLLTIFFAIYGAFGIGLGIFFMSAGFISGVAADLPEYSPVTTQVSIGLMGLGALLLVMGIAGMVCAWWLWKAQKWGAVVGIPLLLGGWAIITTLAVLYPSVSFSELAFTIWAANGILLAGLLLSWYNLKAS